MKNCIIVLDDDPTGTQTVHGVPVVTQWDRKTLKTEFEKGSPLFYILTNSRALLPSEAEDLAFEIGQNIKDLNANATVISRSDSTLRGHFPAEVFALAKGLAYPEDYLIVLIPAFIEGKRFTKDDVHFVVENYQWIPAGDSSYAKDKTFGYQNSNLRDWVIEKSKREIKSSEIDSISLQELDEFDSVSIFKKIEETKKLLIVNILNYTQLNFFTETIKNSKRKIIYRSAASLVPSLAKIQSKSLLIKEDFGALSTKTGGLVIVGSHVPKSTAQLEEILKTGISNIVFNVELYRINQRQYINHLGDILNHYLANGQDVLIYTSRKLESASNEEESLLISLRVSAGIVELVRNLQFRPAYVIAKGGITSSDVATKGLGIKRAIVLGQVLPGVSVWQADENSKFPGLTYVVFPGNVGETDGLKEVYYKLKS